MIKSSEYPENWAKIATTVKQTAGYRCYNCRLKCLPPTDSYKHLDLSLRRRLSAQVHHIDRDPSNNNRSNLVCLCSGCHLRMHRHRPQPTPGQLSLKLKLPANRRPHQKQGSFQMTFTDLIERLPRLPMESSEQLKLEVPLPF